MLPAPFQRNLEILLFTHGDSGSVAVTVGVGVVVSLSIVGQCVVRHVGYLESDTIAACHVASAERYGAVTSRGARDSATCSTAPLTSNRGISDRVAVFIMDGYGDEYLPPSTLALEVLAPVQVTHVHGCGCLAVL